MKRSEMVKIMWEFIENIECDYDRYMTEEETDALLAKIEEAGMRAPLLLNQKYKGPLEGWDEE